LGYEEDRPAFQHNILTNAAKEGNLHEGAIVDELKDTYGWRIKASQEVVEVNAVPHTVIRGHVDGICRPKGKRNDRVLEIKTMSRDRFRKWKASGDDARTRLLTDDFAKYGWQISAYMYAYSMPAMYVVKNRDSGELDIDEIGLPPIEWDQIRDKIRTVEMWRLREELPPCDGSSGEKFFCPFQYLHEGDVFGDEPVGEDSPFDDATSALLAGMAGHYVDLAKKVALLKPYDSERKDLGKKIIEALGGSDGTKNTVVGGYAIDRVDNTRSTVNYGTVAEILGVDLDVLKQAIEDAKEKKVYPYVKVKELGDK